MSRGRDPVSPNAPKIGRGEHVDNDETADQETELGVADPESRVSEALAQGRGDVAVQVVEQVDGREDDEAAAREAPGIGPPRRPYSFG